jgi:hypothetical protein
MPYGSSRAAGDVGVARTGSRITWAMQPLSARGDEWCRRRLERDLGHLERDLGHPVLSRPLGGQMYDRAPPQDRSGRGSNVTRIRVMRPASM